MLNGMVMNGRHGMTTTGVRIGLVLLMIDLVIGLGPKMTGIVGPMTGLEVLRTGGVLSSRMQVHLQVRKALRMSRRIPPRVSHRSKAIQDLSRRETWNDDEFVRWSLPADWCVECWSASGAQPECT